MAGAILTSTYCKKLWEKVNKDWEHAYDNMPVWEGVKFFHTYHTSPTFGIFRIRS